MDAQSQQAQAGALGSSQREGATGYDQPPAKRHRSSISLSTREAYDEGQRSATRPYIQQRDPYTQGTSSPWGDRSGQMVPSGPSPQRSEYSYGHQRAGSQSIPPSYVSPRGSGGVTGGGQEYSAFGYPTQSPLYPTTQYYNPYTASRPEQAMPQPVPPERQLPSSIPSQGGQSAQFQRGFDSADFAPANPQYASNIQGMRPALQPSQSYASSQSGSAQRSLPPPQQGSTASLPSLGNTYVTGNPHDPQGSGTMAPQHSQTQAQAQGHGSFAYRGRSSNE